MSQRAIALVIVATSLGLLAVFVSLRNEQNFLSPAPEVEEPVNQTEQSIAQGTQILEDDPVIERSTGTRNTSTEIAQNINVARDSSDTDELIADNDEERQTTPDNSTRTESKDAEAATPSLSQQVRDVIAEVQSRQLDGQWEEALNEMNALYGNFEELNPFEQATLLNFYTNTLLQLEMWQESISAFSLMLTIPDIRPDINARALIALGQLHNQVGEPETAISYYESALATTTAMENMEEQTQRVRRLLSETREAAEN